MENEKRPMIPNIILEDTKQIELFQNDVLRPIIKKKNDVLFELVQHHLKKYKIQEINDNIKKTNKKLVEIFGKDQKFKQFILGVVVGNFTITELKEFLQNQSEYQKRILQIVLQRIKSHISNK